MNSVIRENPYNVKIVRPNKNMQQKVTDNTIKKIACKRCGKIKEDNSLGDFCMKCYQLLAYKNQKEQMENESSVDAAGVSLISPNEMTDNDFISWITQTQKIKFADTLKK